MIHRHGLQCATVLPVLYVAGEYTLDPCLCTIIMHGHWGYVFQGDGGL